LIKEIEKNIKKDLNPKKEISNPKQPSEYSPDCRVPDGPGKLLRHHRYEKFLSNPENTKEKNAAML